MKLWLAMVVVCALGCGVDSNTVKGGVAQARNRSQRAAAKNVRIAFSVGHAGGLADVGEGEGDGDGEGEGER